MKKGLMTVAAFALIAVSIVQVNAAAKPEKGILVGTVVELTTYAMTGDHAGNVDTAKDRAEKGFPVALIEEETNKIWILAYRNSAPASHLELGNKKAAEYVGQMVVLQGLKYTKDDVNVIRFSTISEY